VKSRRRRYWVIGLICESRSSILSSDLHRREGTSCECNSLTSFVIPTGFDLAIAILNNGKVAVMLNAQ
jgi:hypothetical protein